MNTIANQVLLHCRHLAGSSRLSNGVFGRCKIEQHLHKQTIPAFVSKTMISILSFLYALCGHVSSARADQFYPSVEYTCLPGAGYFHLSTAALPDIDAEQLPPLDDMTQGPMGLLTLKNWTEHPIKCQIANNTIEAQIVDYRPPRPTGMCGELEDGSLSIKVNGQEVFGIYELYGGCKKYSELNIRAFSFGISFCVTDFPYGSWAGVSKQVAASITCRVRILAH